MDHVCCLVSEKKTLIVNLICTWTSATLENIISNDLNERTEREISWVIDEFHTYGGFDDDWRIAYVKFVVLGVNLINWPNHKFLIV